MKPGNPRHLLAAGIGALLSLPGWAAEPAAADDMFAFEWNARARYESVDDDAFAQTADAATLRLRLGVRARFGNGWSALVEGEGVGALDDSYNSGANGETAYPAIIDPDGAELNQAYVAWRNDQAASSAGRQRVALENQRWVGNVGWRQNEQTFDAFALEWKAAGAFTTRYFWLDKVHRVNGDDAIDPRARERDLGTHLLDVTFSTQPTLAWGAYVYAHEDHDVRSASTLTAGLRWNGNLVKDGNGWGWRLEAANQEDHGDNPLNFSHSYWLAEPSFTWRGIAWRAGWEHLGGNGTHALQTPLATLHAFNGWADKFLVTPAGGLDDIYVGAGGPLGRSDALSKLKWALVWHDFSADDGDAYGTEWDASLAFPVYGKVTGLFKVADYQTDGFARDTTKFWLQLEWAM